MPPRDRRKRRPPAKVTIAPTIPTVIIEGLPVGGNGASVGLITTPPFVCTCEGEGVTVGVAVLNGTAVTIGVAVGVKIDVGVGVGVTFKAGVGDGVGLGVKDILGVGVTDGAGGLVCCPAA
jgi:CRISPR/Cas system-associated exonuclease Cas4 (RecB family)